MYSKKEIKQISKLERENLRKLKSKENVNRDIPISDDILYISDFTLEKYDHLGDSGNLYLATNKQNQNEKYILKHEYYDCACNEYMYSKIGNKMGIKIAPVKLFVLDNKEKKFKSDFVCGIKYFENCKHVDYDYISKNKDKINNFEDYFRMLGLESLFGESDGIEVVKYNSDIYRLDTTAAFTLSDYFIHPLAYDYETNGINIKESANKIILQLANRNTDSRVRIWNADLDLFIDKIKKQYANYYLETFTLFQKITEKDIDEYTRILTFFYPNIIGDYFKKYLSNLKLDVDIFLDKIQKNNSK